jgi:hypothetical protein
MRIGWLVFASMALGCAHAQGGSGAALASDHSWESGDLYGSSTDDSSLPRSRLAELYEDEPVQTVAEGPVVRWSGGDPGMVAMSRDLPAGSVVRVTRVDDGRSVVLEIAGREPLPFGLLALSDDAARALDLPGRAQVEARVEVLARPELASR